MIKAFKILYAIALLPFIIIVDIVFGLLDCNIIENLIDTYTQLVNFIKK